MTKIVHAGRSYRDGFRRIVRILAVDAQHHAGPIVGLALNENGTEDLLSYRADGTHRGSSDHNEHLYDLQETMPDRIQPSQWRQCPICGEHGMPFVEEECEPGRGYITCHNLACDSNAGTYGEPVEPRADILTPSPEQVYSVGSYKGVAALFVSNPPRLTDRGTVISLAVPILSVTEAPAEPEKTVQMVADSLNLLATASTVIPNGPIYWSEEEMARMVKACTGSIGSMAHRKIADEAVAILRERNPL